MTWPHRDGRYEVSDDPARLDVDAVHAYLARSDWAEGIPRETVERALDGSLCFGLYAGAEQVGLARVVTDRATFAYLCDVYVLEAHRGQKLAVWLMECVMAHPDVQGLRRWMLATHDAHGLYRRFGFHGPERPDRLMELKRPAAYASPLQAPSTPAPSPLNPSPASDA